MSKTNNKPGPPTPLNQSRSHQASGHPDSLTAMATATLGNLTAIIALLITAATAASDAPPGTGYTNHTVGGAAGWFFNGTANTSATNYSSWVATLTFNLGDFLSKLRTRLTWFIVSLFGGCDDD